MTREKVWRRDVHGVKVRRPADMQRQRAHVKTTNSAASSVPLVLPRLQVVSAQSTHCPRAAPQPLACEQSADQAIATRTHTPLTIYERHITGGNKDNNEN